MFHLFLSPTAHIFSILEMNVFLNTLKLALPSPYINPETNVCISVINVIGKLLWKFILSNFLISYNILNRNQFGFQENKLTNDASVDISDFIYNGVEKGTTK